MFHISRSRCSPKKSPPSSQLRSELSRRRAVNSWYHFSSSAARARRPPRVRNPIRCNRRNLSQPNHFRSDFSETVFACIHHIPTCAIQRLGALLRSHLPLSYVSSLSATQSAQLSGTFSGKPHKVYSLHHCFFLNYYT